MYNVRFRHTVHPADNHNGQCDRMFPEQRNPVSLPKYLNICGRKNQKPLDGSGDVAEMTRVVLY